VALRAAIVAARAKVAALPHELSVTCYAVSRDAALAILDGLEVGDG
jgi:hypothetical protein